MEYKELAKTGMKISTISLGGAAFGGLYNEVDEEEAIKVVKKALDSGINYIDTAPLYGEGKSEILLGKALKGIDRSSYYLATKVGHYKVGDGNDTVDSCFDFSASATLQSVKTSLKRLGLDYIDLIQVHDVEFCSSPDVILSETLPALKQLKESGKVKHIGITGYSLSPLRYLVERSSIIETVLSYCRLTLWDSSFSDNFTFFADRDIGLLNACPFGMGLLSRPNSLPHWHPAPKPLRQACYEAMELCQDKEVDLCKLALQYCCSIRDVTSTIFSTSRLSELEADVEYYKKPLTNHERAVLTEIQQKYMQPLNNMNWEEVIKKCSTRTK